MTDIKLIPEEHRLPDGKLNTDLLERHLVSMIIVIRCSFRKYVCISIIFYFIFFLNVGFLFLSVFTGINMPPPPPSTTVFMTGAQLEKYSPAPR